MAVKIKSVLALIAIVALSQTSLAQHSHPPGDLKPISLLPGLGEVVHPVSTTSPEAQRYFNQGLALAYGFNHEEAVRSFRRAAELDPQMPMAYWGIALALGPNINLPIDAERMKLAAEAVQKARSLSAKASEPERAYIDALAKRYSTDSAADWKKLDRDYRDAMRDLAKRYPDDLDAATLYAESIMDLNPWNFWSKDGKPTEGTEEMVAVLESVLRRNPDHIGANHYYIHGVEASPHPEWAQPAAEKLKALAPAAGHLVHMPAHIDMRTGNYEASARSNAYAAEADRAYFKMFGEQTVYPMMYYSHNLHFLAVSHSIQGRFSDASKAAGDLRTHLGKYIAAPMPEEMLGMVDSLASTPTLMLIRFRRWSEMLAAPPPPPKLRGSTAIWHFGRGLAFAANGKLTEAKAEQAKISEAESALPQNATFGLSRARTVFAIAQNMLNARIALASNDKKAAVESLRKAVELEGTLGYDEPPDWYIYPREALGAALMSSGNYAEAEQVFRADLQHNARNGRSLFGLMKSLEAQGKKHEAGFVRMEYEKAWKNADAPLRLEDL